MNKIIVLFLLTFAAYEAMAQKPDTKISVTGSLIAGTDGKAWYFSMGGPGLKCSFSKKTFLSVNMLPSLRIIKDNVRPVVTPILGTGILFGYKRLIAVLPFYYIASLNKWKASVGLGIRFGK
jgi:hypothetical protein